MGKCSSEQEAIDKKNYLISLNFAPPDSIIIHHPSNRQENTAIYGTVAVGTPIGTDTFIKEFMKKKLKTRSKLKTLSKLMILKLSISY